MFIINTFSTCFGHHYAHLQEKPSQRSHPTTQRPTTATNHIQQNQRSNTRLGLLKMGIMMPETC